MILQGRDAASIARAAQALRDGHLVALPTETVYGLGADAEQDQAVAQIFAAKGRPSDHPLIVHVADARGVDDFAAQVPDFARALVQRYWPGPLTLILPRRAEVAAAAAGGQNSVGLRCPSHPVAHALLSAARELGVRGVAAPSANQFGRVSPTTALHVQGEFDPDLLILDGGACDVGIESTIVDCTRGAPVLLRPGRITREEIERTCAQVLTSASDASTDQTQALAQPAPRASGTLASHYAPRAKVQLMTTAQLQLALQEFQASKSTTGNAEQQRIAVYARSAVAQPIAVQALRVMPADAHAAAQQLFAVLRELDDLHVQSIWVEQPPAGDDWEGVRDRLQRAAS